LFRPKRPGGTPGHHFKSKNIELATIKALTGKPSLEDFANAGKISV
jgi:hypothetical protein